ncbi:MAG: hypothetical protein A4E26_01739 [Methanobacterium sp. PtaU1.Bin097]|nr:MAG: hypothetical protein A4E26_01739 [Methanobacterium sp. PtaU1.Bin097]
MKLDGYVKEDVKLIQEFRETRNLKKASINGYLSAIKPYLELNQMSLTELLQEAEAEEKEMIPLKKRKVKQHLIKYRSYCITHMSSGTAHSYYMKIRSIYNHFEVQLPTLPRVTYKQDYVINYEDLPTREHIQDALKISEIGVQAIILFMATSGTAKAEALSLTLRDFINATKEYHQGAELSGILDELDGKNDIVPTWYLKRIKTDKYYYTFNHPEATQKIIEYLKTRDYKSLDEKVFPFLPSLVLDRFQKINDHFGWGRKGKYRFFRAHTLRKYHASNIGLPADQIDALQGRSKNVVHETYIKPNPVELKKIYMGAMHRVAILREGESMDGVELLKKKEEIEKTAESRNNLNPVFSDDGVIEDTNEKDSIHSPTAIYLFKTEIKPLLENKGKPLTLTEIQEEINSDYSISYFSDLIRQLKLENLIYSWKDGRNSLYHIISEQEWLRQNFKPEENGVVEIDEDEPLKRCTRCKEILPISYFGKNGNGRQHPWCHLCVNDYHQEKKEIKKPKKEKIKQKKEKVEDNSDQSFKKLVLEDALNCCEQESITPHLRILSKLEKAESK